jgi:subtilisin family serine protease
MSIFPDDWSFADITQVTYRGQVYNTGSGFDAAQLNSWGFIAGQRIPQRVSALDADIQDAIDEGIIIVGAAGNGSWKHDIPGGPDWDNSFQMAYRYPGQTFYYMRGASPTANDQNINGGFDITNICVGAIDSYSVDQKVTFSDCGPGVDIWAPGTNIISAIPNEGYGVPDPRNSNFFISKFNGTSMASPQVCGVIACALELYPNMKQADAKAYVLFHAKTNQLTTTNGGPTDGQDLQGTANKFLYYYKERNTQGNIFPKINYKPRPSTGAVFPRTRIKRTI